MLSTVRNIDSIRTERTPMPPLVRLPEGNIINFIPQGDETTGSTPDKAFSQTLRSQDLREAPFRSRRTGAGTASRSRTIVNKGPGSRGPQDDYSGSTA